MTLDPLLKPDGGNEELRFCHGSVLIPVAGPGLIGDVSVGDELTVPHIAMGVRGSVCPPRAVRQQDVGV